MDRYPASEAGTGSDGASCDFDVATTHTEITANHEILTPSTKLDIMGSSEINKISLLNMVTIVSCLLLQIWFIVKTRITAEEESYIAEDGRKIAVVSANASSKDIVMILILEMGPWFLMTLVYFIVTPIYLLRVYRNNSFVVTLDQKLVATNLTLCSIAANPVAQSVLLYGFILYPEEGRKIFLAKPWTKFLVYPAFVFNMLTFNCGIWLYVWARFSMFGSFEKLSDMQRFRRFILPKLAVVLTNFVARAIMFVMYNVNQALMPIATLICFVQNYRVTRIFHVPSFIATFITTVLELCALFGIAYEAMRAKRTLRNADYFKHRSRIIGYKFFTMHCLLFLGSMILFDDLNSAIGASGNRIRRMFLERPEYKLITWNPVMPILLTFWGIIIAYVSLPPDSVGFRGWFKPCGVQDVSRPDIFESPDPISISLKQQPITSTSIFGWRDVTMMFNLSWVAYMKTKDKMYTNLSRIKSMDAFEVLQDDEFGTQAIFVSSMDRILVAFRGTVNNLNIRTDLQVALVPFLDFLPSRRISNNDAYLRNIRKNWKGCKIHKGFAVAYLALAERVLSLVERLISENMRPIFLTGHSLGGALATVCGLDLILSGIPINADKVTVTSFGSPKCGNKKWSTTYNKVISSNWRVKIQNDIVTLLPKFGYAHVGKEALFTVGGYLLLDPSALDKSWSNEIPSFDFHKKPAYKIAFMVVSEKCLSGFDCGIWPFPVKEEEVRRWEKSTAFTFSERAMTTLLLQATNKAE